ncbi:MAG: B12-binding domain-containing radical SAM protein [Nanoarchaeota archaeon]|nr:B12-binding domain-containing radical SAM protein [Nanoarchaeota archaeon]
MKKVILINPPSKTKVIREGRCEQRADSYQYLMVPISLPSVAAVLRKGGFEVEIIDCIAEEISLEELESTLKKRKPLLAVVNVATMSFDTDKETAEVCRKLKIPCAAMGMHVTTIPQEALKNSEFGMAIMAEPELITLNLSKAIRDKKNLKTVKGIAFKKGSKIIKNSPEKLIQNLDELPFPARDLLNNEKYTAPITQRPYTLIITARGCPYGCIFCTASNYYGKKPRIRSPENIVDEIEEVITKYKIRDIGMWADTFTFSKDQVIGISKEIIKRRLKIDWFCNSRVDTLNEEMVSQMAKSGCKAVTFGVESLDENILKQARKNISFKQVKNAIGLCKKYGIKSQLHLIFGLPGETRESIETTIKRAIALNPDYAQFYCAVPFPGTEFRRYVVEKGYLLQTNWSEYEINNALVSYPQLSKEEIQTARKKAYRKFYFRPTYILKKMQEFPLREWKKIIPQAYHFFKGWVFSGEIQT